MKTFHLHIKLLNDIMLFSSFSLNFFLLLESNESSCESRGAFKLTVGPKSSRQSLAKGLRRVREMVIKYFILFMSCHAAAKAS